MASLCFAHPVLGAHETSPGHPERPERYDSALQAVLAEGYALTQAPWAQRDAVLKVHTRAHLATLDAAHQRVQAGGLVQLDPDTWMGPSSLEAAYRAAGGAIAAVDAAVAGAANAAFVAARPPGHHAEPEAVMGFCLINSVAVAALHALETLGLERVAVIDIDVHHGNGTQATAEREPRLFFASVHQDPLYPGTGHAHERGAHDNIRNAPLPAGTRGRAWREAVERQLLGALETFRPDLLLISAGFDGHAADPLAQFELDEDDYAWAGARLGRLARSLKVSAPVALLEGGYDLPALGRAAGAFAGALAQA